MGRAMLIICAGMLVALGIVAMGTSSQGKLMTEKTVEYAQKTQALNAAHTAIQIVTQEINKKGIENMDQQYVDDRNSSNSWTPSTVNSADIVLSIEFLNSDWDTNPYFEEDKLRVISKATIDNKYEANVKSVYVVAPFSNLVPDFAGALQLPTGYGSLSVDGNAHDINGTDPDCSESRPPIAVNNSQTKDGLQSHDLNLDGDIAVDNQLDYEPTDELIARLENSENATTVTSDYSENLGTAEKPGVFFIDGQVSLTGQQSEGYGIMVIKDSAHMDYEDQDGNTVSIRGNFEFNGLVIFENAQLFDGSGTPTINGSVLVGDTDPEDTNEIEVDLSGNISINYTCAGEKYAKMGAANTVKQNKYTRVVSSEETSLVKN
ncbi:hypothetical protein CK503_15370 [Aliifodinibius salipaludis]|uniref:Type 4 fimbrial biogenesis protein PilX N-terminal domain-containing protein n=1 Tax=Fodinibius salipaludis TaxID=2032627 RepID=A0A2A2G7A3_9BACT|nr:hypothetical protein [Aliifodinibius salipaludis]PAU92742.1 hypothetical protein CK503_15370 [Aliifodinibius salipaludis]